MFRHALGSIDFNASRCHGIALRDAATLQCHISKFIYNVHQYTTKKKEIRYLSTSQRQKNDNKKSPPHSVDTLIIGGGPIGASTAFHLANQRVGGDSSSGSDMDPSILVVERDPSYQSGSAIYSAGGIRFQFSLEENVRMSLYGIDFLRNAQSTLSTMSPSSTSQSRVDIQYVENGYLFFATNKMGEQQLRENYALYEKIGCSNMIELLSPGELAIRFPWLNVDDILLGSFGCSGEGWFDPWTYIQGLHDKNKSLGVQYATGTIVAAIRDAQSGSVLSVRFKEKSTNDVYDIQVKNVVNAAGAAADHVLDTLGESNCNKNGRPSASLSHPFPVRPRKRSIYFFHCASDQNHDDLEGVIPDMAPLTIDNTGAYFRSEGTTPGTGKFLCGMSPPSEEDHDCYDRRELENADPHLFERHIWPALYHRVPAFGSIKVQSSWAGLYEYNTVDHNCIIDFHPEMSNVLMVNGFSGHGLQHSPAAGRAAAELIGNGNRFETLNLDIFRFDRLLEGGRGPVLEKGIY
mmetsp:Transcript_7670/g.18787  ORF Transcript_7670/g.18787 Transcript_7670/m.18787 type:complete len:519 (+) Transcript_7670:134-1690(+)